MGMARCGTRHPGAVGRFGGSALCRSTGRRRRGERPAARRGGPPSRGRLRRDRPAGRGRPRGRLPGPRLHRAGGHQGPARPADRGRAGARPLRPRGGGDQAGRALLHRPGPVGGADRRPPVHRERVRPGPVPAPPAARRGPTPRLGAGPPGDQHGDGPGRHPRRGRGTPRLQTGQRADGPGWPGRDRLRHRPRPRRERDDDERGQPGGGHTGVHGTGTARGRRDRPTYGHLRVGDHDGLLGHGGTRLRPPLDPGRDQPDPARGTGLGRTGHEPAPGRGGMPVQGPGPAPDGPPADGRTDGPRPAPQHRRTGGCPRVAGIRRRWDAGRQRGDGTGNRGARARRIRDTRIRGRGRGRGRGWRRGCGGKRSRGRKRARS